MAARHDYLAYKHDTSLLLRWMIQTSNNIIKARKAEIAELQSHELNKRGQIRVDGIVPLCGLIAKHVTNVSPSIYRLFQSIIDARTASYSRSQRVAIQIQDKNVEECNSTYKFFIGTLVAVLEALGSTPSKAGASQNADHGASSVSKEDAKQLISANRFVPLQNGEIDGSSDKEVPQQSSTTQPRNKPVLPSISEEDPVNLSLEDYKLIEEKDSGWGYMWAVSDLARNWIQLRRSLQEVWRDVAYNHLNIAIGGTLSNSAIAMIQRRSRAIFVNFPDHDSYGSIMNVVTWGLPYELQGKMLSHLWSLPQFRPDNFTPSKEICVDAKEQLMAYSYNYLVEFITDPTHSLWQANQAHARGTRQRGPQPQPPDGDKRGVPAVAKELHDQLAV
ncbi:hypothetical protein QC764_609510 [Podospora pseudoanserina]|uniref:DUF6604 domain-containing protein n=1 Tax=Podospora pseudoanserina TaxID=2609844 RepID=A0ABR0HUT1_9PEZI|nr:hypothetical protein QC764_609510 [Podospora pseudoanserina]